MAAKGGEFPGGWDTPLGFPKPSWGKWELRHTAIADVHRIPSEAAGYCYSSRILYADREFWSANWVDLYDSNRKLWKTIAYYNQIGDVPGMASRGRISQSRRRGICRMFTRPSGPPTGTRRNAEFI